MKSEERHQLLTNDLEVVTKKVAGTLEQYVMVLVPIVVGILAVVGVGYWWSQSSEYDSASGWTRLETAQNPEDLGDVADRFKGKPAGQWALLINSEKTLQTAMPLMFTNREIALTDVAKAQEGFEALILETGAAPMIRERAMWGVALCLETACDGQTAKPIKAYERLLADFPNSMFKTVAEERIAALKNKDATDFYAWFSKENPQPPEARPRDFKDGVNVPAPKGSKESKEPFDDPDEFIPKKTEEPAKEETPPGPENKTAEPPQTDKPAEGEKPAGSESPSSSEKPGEKN
jgi:hypothetical protein